MGNKKSSFNFSADSLYISNTIFEFGLQNLQRVKPAIELSRFEAFLDRKDLKGDRKVPINLLFEFFQLCQSNDLTLEEFYNIGNIIHGLHFSFVTFLFQTDSNLATSLKKEINLFNLKYGFYEEEFRLVVEVDKILVLDAKQMCGAILKLLHGYIDRLFQIYLGNKPKVIQKEDSLEISYSQKFVSKFDIARYITNEQFFFSRLKNFIYEAKEEGLKQKVEFYLFRDISFSIEEIASKLGVSIRALQRKLKEEDTSFRMTKEMVRKELSEKYLSDLSLNIQEVSELLAYSERGAFEKAFKKWFGKNPIVYRKELGLDSM